VRRPSGGPKRIRRDALSPRPGPIALAAERGEAVAVLTAAGSNSVAGTIETRDATIASRDATEAAQRNEPVKTLLLSIKLLILEL
jgi:hypothetical protein